MAEILLIPTRRKRSRSHAGDCALGRTPRITRDANAGQPADSSVTGNTASWPAATGALCRLEVAPPLRRRVIPRDAEHTHAVAAIRRRVDIQHAVVEVQRIPQILDSAAAKSDSSMMPSWFSPKPSSRAEHSMPFDS